MLLRRASEVCIASFLQPLDKPVPMVATADIGRVAAELLEETWSGHRVVELEGPRRVTPNEIAATFSELLGRTVTRRGGAARFMGVAVSSQGMKNPEPRIQMLDGFNEGWIEFEAGEAGSRKGDVALKTVLAGLVERETGGSCLADDADAVGGPVDEGGFAVDEVAVDGAEVAGVRGDGAVVAHDKVLAVGDDHLGHGAGVAKAVGERRLRRWARR